MTNIHTGSRLINTKGKQFYNAMIACKSNLYYTADLSKKPDIVDIGNTKGINKDNISATTFLELSSEHTSLLWTITNVPQQNMTWMQLTSHATNWLNFIKYISYDLISYKISNKDDINCRLCNIENVFWLVVSSANRTHKSTYENSYIFSNNEIDHHIKVRKALRREWQQTELPSNKNKLTKATAGLKRNI